MQIKSSAGESICAMTMAVELPQNILELLQKSAQPNIPLQRTPAQLPIRSKTENRTENRDRTIFELVQKITYLLRINLSDQI